MGKRLKLWLWMVLVFAVGIIMWKPDEVKAANPSEVTIRPHSRTSSYDITGDQKPDDIMLDADYQKAYVYINNKLCCTVKLGSYYHGILAKIYTLKNGKPFLYLYSNEIIHYGPTCGLYQYRSGKMVQIINFNKVLKGGYEYYCEDIKVKNNTLTATIYMWSYSLGESRYDLDYVYKKGTLKQKNAFARIRVNDFQRNPAKQLVVNKTIDVYSKVSNGKKVYTLEKGNRVNFDKLYHGVHGEWIRVKFNGKYGWIKCLEKLQPTEPKMFSNIVYKT